MINQATFSMKTFDDHVRQVNDHFNRFKTSSLKPLINALGGDYSKSKGADQRTLGRNGLLAVQGIIWPLGDGVSTSPWGVKKRKYASALGYLAQTIFQLVPGDALLVASYKTGWGVEKQLANSMKFVTSSGADEDAMRRSQHLSGQFASELCIPDGGMIGDWRTHKLVFGAIMRTDNQGRLQSSGHKTQGFGRNVYCFELPAQTDYLCQYDLSALAPNGNPEIAFPDDINISRIRAYNGRMPRPNNPWPAPNWT